MKNVKNERRLNAKTIYCLLLAAIMLFSLAIGCVGIFEQNVAYADSGYVEYDIWVGGVRVTSDNKDNITGEGITGTASYNTSTSTLTLNGVTILKTASYKNAAIYAGISLKLLLVGENTVTGPDVTNSLTGTGDVSKATSYGIYSTDTVTINGVGSVFAYGGTVNSLYGDSFSYGIYAGYNFVINGGTVNARGGVAEAHGDANCCGIYSGNNFKVNDGVINVSSGTLVSSDGTANGIYSVAGIIMDYGVVSVTVNAQNYYGDDVSTAGIITESGFTISGGEVNVFCEKNYLSSGIQATNTIAIIDGEVTVSTTKDCFYNLCLFSQSSITISGGVVDVTAESVSGTGSLSNGLFSSVCNITVSGGSVVAKGQISALNSAPDTSAYTNSYIKASTNFDGSSPATAYDSSDIDTYKYLSISPTYNVTHTLTNVTATASTAGSGKAVNKTKYTTTLTADTSYYLPATISVTIGGATATLNTDYTYNVSTGVVTIPAEKVTGAIVITAVGASKQTLIITLAPQNYPYSGGTKAFVVAGTNVTGFTVEYMVGGAYVTTAPKNVGSYKVKVTRAEDANCYAFSAEIENGLVINKAWSSITVDQTEIVKTYGEAWTLPIATSTFGTVVCDKTAMQMTSPNTYVVKYYVEGNSNYFGDSKELIVTINKAAYDMSGITFADKAVKEDGSAQSIVIEGVLPTGVTVKYSGNGESKAGIYTITATFTGDFANYFELPPMTATLTIKTATLEEKVDGNTSEKIDVIVGSQNGLNPNIVLVVTEILNENATIMIESNEVIEKAYEVTLESDGVSIQPDGDITIKLLIPETLKGINFRIVHKHVDELINVQYTIEGDYAVFTTDKLSEFAFVRDADRLSACATISIILCLILLLLVLIYLYGYFFLYRKGKLDENAIRVIYAFLPRGDEDEKEKNND